jgi:hypothetical protein
VAGRLFCTCWLIYAVHWAPFMIREQFPAVTLATRGTLNVERFVGWSPDIFQRSDGRAFINNNPGASILGAFPLLIARPALDALERWNDRSSASAARRELPQFAASAAVRERREWYFMAVAFLTAVGVMAPLSALCVTLLAGTLSANGVPRPGAIGVGLLFGFATPVFVRTGYLNHNLLVCDAGLLAALLLWGRAALTARRVVLAGALGGFAVLCDYSGVLVLGAAGIYAWLRAGDNGTGLQERLQVAALYAAGATPLLAGLALYQWWAFGASTLPSQHFMPAIEETARGYRGMGWPSLEIASMNFFDPRFGLFAVCPLLALAFAAPLIRGGRFRVPRRETWMIFLFFAAFSLFCASNQYSRLQWSTGIRYLVPTIPGLLLLSAQVLQAAPSALRRLAIALSVGMMWLPAVTHRSLIALAANPWELKLSWLARMEEYGAVEHPGRLSAAVLVITAVALYFIWRGHASAATIHGAARSGSRRPPVTSRSR